MSETRADRIRTLIALEIARVTEDLELRKAFLMGVWTRHRTRVPFVETTFNRWQTLGFPDMTELESREVLAATAFFRELDDLRLYLAFTDDMPRTLEQNLSRSLARLRREAQSALLALGAEPLAARFGTPNAAFFGHAQDEDTTDDDSDALHHRPLPISEDDASPAAYWGGVVGGAEE